MSTLIPRAKYLTAMLIDDNEIDNLINQKMLEGTNFAERIYVYTSGRSALEYLKNLERNGFIDKKLIPDVIFLDINMPLMDGFQFLAEFELLGKDIIQKSKIAMLTTSINPSDKSMSDKSKFVTSFITKPLSEESLTRFCQ